MTMAKRAEPRTANRTKSKKADRELDDLELELDEGSGGENGRKGLRQLLEEKPLAAGIVGLTLGLLAGLSVPVSRREHELLGTTRDRLLKQARRKGLEALDRGKEAARDAVALAAGEIAAATAGKAGKKKSKGRREASRED
jgi:hypothetical protein